MNLHLFLFVTFIFTFITLTKYTLQLILDVTYAVSHNHTGHSLNSRIWADCFVDITNDGYTDDDFNGTGVVGVAGINFTVQYIIDPPDGTQDTTVTCQNHVSSTNFEFAIILRENITGGMLILPSLAFAVGSLVNINISLITGSHVQVFIVIKVMFL